MIRISDQAMRYLSVQVGELSAFLEDGSWEARYVNHLVTRMAMIEPWLPGDGVREYCDIGGGMCGIGILLNNYYGGNLSVNVVDGDGPPIVLHHSLPFNNALHTNEFLKDNGVHNVTVWQPSGLPQIQMDLITSFRAWCFHIEPEQYLDWVKSHLTSRGRLIVDVRSDGPDYLTVLRKAFPIAHRIGAYGKGTLWQFQS